ncbi:UNVERIFIED_ORG: ABC-type transport system substrate-binding protein, partial [Comamonas terrigena]
MVAGVWMAGCSQQTGTETAAQQGAPVQGGELVYLEQQAHTNLYPPAGGFYPNGGVLNQITDKLTYQDPKTLEIQPWIAESWSINDNATAFTFKLRSGVTFSDGTPLDASAVAKNFDTYGLGNKSLKLPVSEVINNYERSEVVDPLMNAWACTHNSRSTPSGTQSASRRPATWQTGMPSAVARAARRSSMRGTLTAAMSWPC